MQLRQEDFKLGDISYFTNQALLTWIALHHSTIDHARTKKTHKLNTKPEAHAIAEEVQTYLLEKYGIDPAVRMVPKKLVHEAIRELRGYSYHTFAKYKNMVLASTLIKDLGFDKVYEMNVV